MISIIKSILPRIYGWWFRQNLTMKYIFCSFWNEEFLVILFRSPFGISLAKLFAFKTKCGEQFLPKDHYSMRTAGYRAWVEKCEITASRKQKAYSPSLCPTKAVWNLCHFSFFIINSFLFYCFNWLFPLHEDILHWKRVGLYGQRGFCMCFGYLLLPRFIAAWLKTLHWRIVYYLWCATCIVVPRTFLCWRFVQKLPHTDVIHKANNKFIVTFDSILEVPFWQYSFCRPNFLANCVSTFCFLVLKWPATWMR